MKTLFGIVCVGFSLGASDSLGKADKAPDFSYMLKEQHQLKCTSAKKTKSPISVTVQRETFIGNDGYPKENLLRLRVQVEGKHDGKRVVVDRTFSASLSTEEVLSQDPKREASRFAIFPAYEIKRPQFTVHRKPLDELTVKPGFPGTSTVVRIKDGAPYSTGDLIVSIVHGHGLGLSAVYVQSKDLEHIEPSQGLECSDYRDSADEGEAYAYSFEVI